MIIAIDFDGTIVTHMYPSIGEPVKGAIPTIKKLIANEHKIILYTIVISQIILTNSSHAELDYFSD